MSPTSYQLLHSAVSIAARNYLLLPRLPPFNLTSPVVLVAGLEPARMLVRRILSPLRLPIPPHEQDALRALLC